MPNELAIVRDNQDQGVALSNLFPSEGEWKIMSTIATTMVGTGFMPAEVKTPAQALAIIMTGRELGIAPMTALRQISVIHGKTMVQGQLMVAMMNRAGHRVDPIEYGPTKATVEIQRKGEEKSFQFSFTMEEAVKSGLAGKTGGMYEKWASEMLWWKAVARGCKVKGADVILGLYLPEEFNMQIIENDDGTTQIVEYQEKTNQQPQPQPQPKQAAKPKQIKEEVKQAAAPAAQVQPQGQVVETEVREIPNEPEPEKAPAPAPAPAPAQEEEKPAVAAGQGKPKSKAEKFAPFNLPMEKSVFDEWCAKLGTNKDNIAQICGGVNFKQVVEAFKKNCEIEYVSRLILYQYIKKMKEVRPNFAWEWDMEFMEPLYTGQDDEPEAESPADLGDEAVA